MRALPVLLLLACLLGAATQVALAKPGKDQGGRRPQDDGGGQGDGGSQGGDGQGARHHDHESDDPKPHREGHRHESQGDEKDGGNQQDDDQGGSAPASGPTSVTVPPPVVAPLQSVGGDAAVRQVVYQERGQLRYVFVLGGLGPAVAHGVRLDSDLPALGATWSLAGLASRDCTLQATHLSCPVGDLAPGELRVVQATSRVAAAPAWQVETTAHVAASNDAVRGNDQATTVVGVLLT